MTIMLFIWLAVIIVLFRNVSSRSEEYVECVPDDVYTDGDYLALIAYKCSEDVHQINFTHEHPTYFGCSDWDVSAHLSTKVYQIKFDGCQMSQIEYDYFKIYPYVVEFHISFAGLDRLSKETFQGATFLRKFDASHNNITVIPALLFFNAERIEEIDFSHNKIKRFEQFAVSGAKQLMRLDVSFNFLQRIQADYFESALNLEYLNLSQNNISVVAPNAFKTLAKLTTLDLSFNNITKLNENMFDGLTNLQSLHLSNLSNHTIVIESFAFAGLESLNLLDLSQSHIASIKMGTFQGLSNVQTLKLIAVRKIEKFSFAGIDNLKELDLSNDAKMPISSAEASTFIDKEAFDNLTQLLALNLASNPVEHLSVGTFSKLMHLERLNLSHIQLAAIKLGTFSHLKNLQTLDISRNRLRKFDFGHFLPGDMNLQQIYLNGNSLTELEGFQYLLFTNLSLLNIAENRFNCSYLKQFLTNFMADPRQIEFSDRSSFNPHVDNIHGIRCISSDTPNNEFSPIVISTVRTMENDKLQLTASLNDLNVIKILLLFVCVLLTVILFIILIQIIVSRNRLLPKNHEYLGIFEQSQRQSSMEVSNF